ncbi:hypothetical protein ABIA09_004208 [Bradyrhizobium yuanmingense]
MRQARIAARIAGLQNQTVVCPTRLMAGQSRMLPCGRAAAFEPFQTGPTSRYSERSNGAETTPYSRPPSPSRTYVPRRSVADVMGVSALVMRVFLPFAVGYYLSYLFRTINALIAAPLTSELGLDAGDLGLLTSVYFLTFAVAQIPVGILLDRYGPRLIQSVLLVAAAVGAAIVCYVRQFAHAASRPGATRSRRRREPDRRIESPRSLVSEGPSSVSQRPDGHARCIGSSHHDLAGAVVAGLGWVEDALRIVSCLHGRLFGDDLSR